MKLDEPSFRICSQNSTADMQSVLLNPLTCSFFIICSFRLHIPPLNRCHSFKYASANWCHFYVMMGATHLLIGQRALSRDWWDCCWKRGKGWWGGLESLNDDVFRGRFGGEGGKLKRKRVKLGRPQETEQRLGRWKTRVDCILDEEEWSVTLYRGCSQGSIKSHFHNVSHGPIRDEQRYCFVLFFQICVIASSLFPLTNPPLPSSIVSFRSVLGPPTYRPSLILTMINTRDRDKGNIWQFATLSTSHPSHINASLLSAPPTPAPHLLVHVLPPSFNPFGVSLPALSQSMTARQPRFRRVCVRKKQRGFQSLLSLVLPLLSD